MSQFNSKSTAYVWGRKVSEISCKRGKILLALKDREKIRFWAKSKTVEYRQKTDTVVV